MELTLGDFVNAIPDQKVLDKASNTQRIQPKYVQHVIRSTELNHMCPLSHQNGDCRSKRNRKGIFFLAESFEPKPIARTY